MSISIFINSWLRDIVILFIFISIVDLVMAKGKMKKYIDFVIGLLIIFTVINPFLKLGKLNFNLDTAVMKYIDMDLDYGQEVNMKLEDEVEHIYISKITNEISRLLEENSIYRVYESKLDIEREGEFGEINSIVLIIEPKDNVVMNSSIIVSEVETITIGSGFKQQDKTDTDNSFLDLKSLIGHNFNIDSKLITISMRDKED